MLLILLIYLYNVYFFIFIYLIILAMKIRKMMNIMKTLILYVHLLVESVVEVVEQIKTKAN